MKRIANILILMAMSLMTMAQEQMPQAYPPCDNWLPGYPAHYCECRNTSIEFKFPLQVELTDTMWFSTTVEDLKVGLSAYWLAGNSLTFEVYAFCSSIVPTITMTVGGNQMREMSVEEINSKLEANGSSVGGFVNTLTPRIKVYPNGAGGTVYCYPYDQGPQSTCDSTLRFLPRMTYVCDQAEEVYKLHPSNIAADGLGFIRWKQKNNLPANIRLTKDSCNGAEIANVTLQDSMHVYMLDSAKMKAIRTAKDTIYVHVTHDASYVGRVIYRNTIKWDEQRIDTTICQGMALQLPDTMLRQSTVYPNDILFKNGDTLSATTYYLTVEQPEMQYDTLRLKASQLPYNYNNQIIPKDGWGDYTYTFRQTNRCDNVVNVHVERIIIREETEVYDTICLGMKATYGGVTYDRDTVIRDSLWKDQDTWQVRDITIHFTDPETEFDTLAIPLEWFNADGYWDAGYGVLIKGYGDTLVVKTQRNKCTRWIQLHIEPRSIGTDINEVPVSDISAIKYMRDGVMYIRREGQDYDILGRPIKRQ